MKGSVWIALVIVIIFVILINWEIDKGLNSDDLVTIQLYNNLENRMEFADVIEMLGQPDLINFKENTADEVVFEDELTIYTWEGVDPNSGIDLYFRDERLYKKEQVGLE